MGIPPEALQKSSVAVEIGESGSGDTAGGLAKEQSGGRDRRKRERGYRRRPCKRAERW